MFCSRYHQNAMVLSYTITPELAWQTFPQQLTFSEGIVLGLLQRHETIVLNIIRRELYLS